MPNPHAQALNFLSCHNRLITILLMNVFIALKGTHFLFLFVGHNEAVQNKNKYAPRVSMKYSKVHIPFLAFKVHLNLVFSNALN